MAKRKKASENGNPSKIETSRVFQPYQSRAQLCAMGKSLRDKCPRESHADWQAPPGKDVLFGIRPEHLVLGQQGIAAEVGVIEPTGMDTHVFAKSSGGELSAIFRERYDFHPGARITLAPVPSAIHVFDAASGKRL